MGYVSSYKCFWTRKMYYVHGHVSWFFVGHIVLIVHIILNSCVRDVGMVL